MKKLHRLASEMLKLMVTEYHSSENKCFSFEFFKEHYPNTSDAQLSDALYLLQNDDFVSILPGDNVANITSLKPFAISSVEEDTFLKKGYEMFKEIKSLIS